MAIRRKGYPYKVIYVDPPWTYDNARSDNAKLGGSKYDKMTMAELKDLPIKDLGQEDCGLFMWATLPKLPEAIELMKSWEFTFTTVPFVWIKTDRLARTIRHQTSTSQEPFHSEEALMLKDIYSGMGSWTNGNAEIVLFGKRGAPKRKKKNIKQIVIAPLGRHSAKPPEVRDRIVSVMGNVSRIELFARENTKGWDAWGNEKGLEVDLNIADGMVHIGRYTV